MQPSRIASFVAGSLVPNAAPHLATAVTGRRHLTPVGGRDSGPGVNGVWAALNIGAAIGLLAWSARGKRGPVGHRPGRVRTRSRHLLGLDGGKRSGGAGQSLTRRTRPASYGGEVGLSAAL